MKGRIRTIKPEALLDEELWDLEADTGLPVFRAFVGLWCYADREGRFEWRPRALGAVILPYSDADFSRVLDALATRGFVLKYACDGREYGVVRTFKRHQVVNNRESDSVLPDPDECEAIPVKPTRKARVRHATGARTSGREGKGREGKGTISPSRRGRAGDVSPSGADEVFGHWQRVLGKPRAKLSPERRRAIDARLRDGTTVDELKRAIDGCAKSPFHLGQNDQGKRHDDLTLICRNRSKVEQFMGYLDAKPVLSLARGVAPAAKNHEFEDDDPDEFWRQA